MNSEQRECDKSELDRSFKLGLYRVEAKYTDYLRSFQKHVQSNNSETHNTPWIGLVIQQGDFDYFVPLTSDKNNKVKTSIISHRIEVKHSNKKVEYLGAILFYNMIPVPKGLYSKIDFDEESKVDPKYSDLLKKQYYWMNIIQNKKTIINKSLNLYESRYTKDGRRKLYDKMCLDFKKLEDKAIEYIETHFK